MEYNIDFDKADELFETYLNSCQVFSQKYTLPSELIISTITITGQIGSCTNKNLVFHRIEITDDIIYVEFNDMIKGIKPKKKKKRITKNTNIIKKVDKRRKNKGKSFGNQISLGIKGTLDNHKKPICVKLFKNGGIHMAGCRSIEEGNQVYNIVSNMLRNIPVKYKINGSNDNIYLYPVKDINTLDDSDLTVKMINSTFRTNFQINQLNLYKELKEYYNTDDVFVTYNCCLSSPIRCYLMKMSIYDETKKKNKQPSIFIYRSGSINVVVPCMELLQKSYDFINNFLKLKYDKIVQTELKLSPY